MIKIIDKAKKVDADRLISIACVKDGEDFRMYYHFSKSDTSKIKEFNVPVPKGEEVESLMPVYANAELLESEATELYGVMFNGNPSSGKRLFLEEK